MYSQTSSIYRHGLPRPLSQLYIHHRMQSTHLARRNTLFALTEGVVRFVTTLACCNVIILEGEHQKLISKSLEVLFNPSFGKLFYTFKNLVDVLEKEKQYMFCPELIALRHHQEWKDAIEKIKAARNNSSHSGLSTPEEKARELNQELKSSLSVVLQEIEFLHKYKLGQFQGLRGRKNQTAEWLPAQGASIGESIKFTFDGQSSLPQKKAMIFNPNHEALVLYPLLTSEYFDGSLDYYWPNQSTDRDCMWVHPSRTGIHLGQILHLDDEVPVSFTAYQNQAKDWHELHRDIKCNVDVLKKLHEEPEFLENYSELTKIGSGGMGVVYRAVNNLNQTRALKVLRKYSVHESRDRRRFEQEGRILARLDHKNIVKIYKAGLFDDQRPYFEMEYLKGHNLQEKIEQSLDDNQPYTVEETLKIIRQVLIALDYIHGEKVIHRDLKPQNIFVTDEEEIKLIDFGISKSLEANNHTQTRTLSIFGSDKWMAPEQQYGQTSPSSDLYSLGLIMSTLLGYPPIEPLKPPVLPSTLSQLNPIYLKATQLNAIDRYQSAQEMLSDLDQVFQENPLAPAVDLKRLSMSEQKSVFAHILLIESTDFTLNLDLFDTELQKLNDRSLFKLQRVKMPFDTTHPQALIHRLEQALNDDEAYDALAFICGSEVSYYRRTLPLFEQKAVIQAIAHLNIPVFTTMGKLNRYPELSKHINQAYSGPLPFIADLRDLYFDHMTQQLPQIQKELNAYTKQSISEQKSELLKVQSNLQKILAHTQKQVAHTFTDILTESAQSVKAIT